MGSVLADDRARWASALAGLHAFRTQDALERAVAELLEEVVPGVAAAICLAEDAGGMGLRLALGSCPLRGRRRVQASDWPLPARQRRPIPFGRQVLGELWLDGALDDDVCGHVDELLAHYGTAVANLALHAEARQATDDYCASLQALEEGIVLFQEEQPAAVTARLLSLASSMVQAAAGALYVLREVGRVDSGLRLEQALGIPETMLATFRGVGDCSWPDVLLAQTAHVARREDEQGVARPMAMLAPEVVPAVLHSVVVLPLRYHGVQAGVCLLFNPVLDSAAPRDLLARLQSFGQLAAALLHRLSLEALTANSVSIARELQIAETIQKRLLPCSAPPTGDYEFAWSSIAAKQIGGDYLDVVASEQGDVSVVVADAAGHGINSALLMTSFRANYRGNAARLLPGELAASLNREVVYEVGPTGMFITAALVRLERGTRRMSVCSAGHNPTLLWRAATGAVERLDSDGPPLGFVAGVDYGRHDCQLASGDVLLLYTDGITEAVNDDQDMFGEERLVALLRANATTSAEHLLAELQQALMAFTGRDRQDDDVSMVVVKVR